MEKLEKSLEFVFVWVMVICVGVISACYLPILIVFEALLSLVCDDLK